MKSGKYSCGTRCCGYGCIERYKEKVTQGERERNQQGVREKVGELWIGTERKRKSEEKRESWGETESEKIEKENERLVRSEGESEL